MSTPDDETTKAGDCDQAVADAQWQAPTAAGPEQLQVLTSFDPFTENNTA